MGTRIAGWGGDGNDNHGSITRMTDMHKATIILLTISDRVYYMYVHSVKQLVMHLMIALSVSNKERLTLY